MSSVCCQLLWREVESLCSVACVEVNCVGRNVVNFYHTALLTDTFVYLSIEQLKPSVYPTSCWHNRGNENSFVKKNCLTCQILSFFNITILYKYYKQHKLPHGKVDRTKSLVRITRPRTLYVLYSIRNPLYHTTQVIKSRRI